MLFPVDERWRNQHNVENNLVRQGVKYYEVNEIGSVRMAVQRIPIKCAYFDGSFKETHIRRLIICEKRINLLDLI